MVFVARAAPLTEALAQSLAERIGEDDELAWPSVAISETVPGEWLLEAYFSAPPDKTATARLAAHARAVAGKLRFAVEELPERDWVAESLKGLKPVRAARFLVHGAHDRDKRRANDIAIEIEAGQAFGTGHHGTTAGCLRAIAALAKAGPIRNALDIGTGSGVLAIAIARLARAPVLASDIDPVATEVARANVRLNGVADRITLLTSASLDRRPFRERAPFDLIVANILAGPLVALAPSIRALLAPGGTLILSGLLPTQGTRITATYRGLGLRLVHASILDGWLTLTLARSRRHRSIAEAASRL